MWSGVCPAVSEGRHRTVSCRGDREKKSWSLEADLSIEGGRRPSWRRREGGQVTMIAGAVWVAPQEIK